ncbi:MAG: hypothetical protein CMN55_01375 [Sneathiella sp.]|jgi:TRAP-type C4-dicarboxylate transport system permease small subunit|uniref:TRAP transporter small permease n=1 Tax=Sneathiella sp. TaxID=1964365 RepID=UPI000C4CA3F2|nr:TRAP transporter small permease [Sneathiella sp.]MAL77756.1 hypothetical protein [Sneathiella sp.]|tara:strand:+ start:388 stop:873 length:486 start_codon:yes stop_codon:yes gene_type:complete
MNNSFHYFERFLVLIAGIAIMVMLSITTISVIGRHFIGAPIPDDVTLNEFLMVFVIFLPFAYVQFKKEHISVTLLADMMPARAVDAIDVLAQLLGLIFYGLMACSAYYYFLDSWIVGSFMEGPLSIPEWPTRLIFFAGVLIMALRLIVDLIKSIHKLITRK